jgi:Ni/Co efflux regulator RcnB
MTRKFAVLLALVFALSIGQSAFSQNSDKSNMKSGRSAEKREERGEERREGRRHRRHRRGDLRHSGDENGNANH